MEIITLKGSNIGELRMYNNQLKEENEQLKQTIESLKQHIENQPREVVRHYKPVDTYERAFFERQCLNNFCVNMNSVLNRYGVVASVRRKTEFVFPKIENIDAATVLFCFISLINHHCKTYCLFLEKTGG